MNKRLFTKICLLSVFLMIGVLTTQAQYLGNFPNQSSNTRKLTASFTIDKEFRMITGFQTFHGQSPEMVERSTWTFKFTGPGGSYTATYSGADKSLTHWHVSGYEHRAYGRYSAVFLKKGQWTVEVNWTVSGSSVDTYSSSISLLGQDRSPCDCVTYLDSDKTKYYCETGLMDKYDASLIYRNSSTGDYEVHLRNKPDEADNSYTYKKAMDGVRNPSKVQVPYDGLCGSTTCPDNRPDIANSGRCMRIINSAHSPSNPQYNYVCGLGNEGLVERTTIYNTKRDYTGQWRTTTSVTQEGNPKPIWSTDLVNPAQLPIIDMPIKGIACRNMWDWRVIEADKIYLNKDGEYDCYSYFKQQGANNSDFTLNYVCVSCDLSNYKVDWTAEGTVEGGGNIATPGVSNGTGGSAGANVKAKLTIEPRNGLIAQWKLRNCNEPIIFEFPGQGNRLGSNEVTEFSELDKQGAEWMLYPVPAYTVSTFALYTPTDDELTLELYNLQGQLIKPLLMGEPVKAGNFEHHIDVSGLAQGDYVLHFYTANGLRGTKRLVRLNR